MLVCTWCGFTEFAMLERELDQLDDGVGQSGGAIKLNGENFKLAREDWESGSDQDPKRCG